jgi:hypothetical protein
MGSNPSPSAKFGEWPNGKATGFDPVDWGFESLLLSQWDGSKMANAQVCKTLKCRFESGPSFHKQEKLC